MTGRLRPPRILILMRRHERFTPAYSRAIGIRLPSIVYHRILFSLSLYRSTAATRSRIAPHAIDRALAEIRATIANYPQAANTLFIYTTDHGIAIRRAASARL